MPEAQADAYGVIGNVTVEFSNVWGCRYFVSLYAHSPSRRSTVYPSKNAISHKAVHLWGILVNHLRLYQLQTMQ